MFSQMLFLLVKKMEILFYSVSFCLPKWITNSFNFAYSIFLALVAGNFLVVAGNFMQVRKGKEGNFGNKLRATGSRGVLLGRISS